MSWSEEVKSLLGKKVRVYLAYKEGSSTVLAFHNKNHETVIEGTLLAFGQDGEFEILDESDTIHYCWPLLAIEEI